MDDDNVIDIEAEENKRVTRGMRRRRARTGQAEKPVSRVMWIALGAIVTVVTLRAFETYFPRQPKALPPPPPGA